MADSITDEHIAGVLRAFVRGCDPMLPRLREIDDVAVARDDVEVDHGLLRRVRDASPRSAGRARRRGRDCRSRSVRTGG